MTGGRSAAGGIKSAGILGDHVAWLDTLHYGPVPAGVELEELRRIRARFVHEEWDSWGGSYQEHLQEFEIRDRGLASCGVHDEVVLWFSQNLVDQLDLIQVLDRLRREPLSCTRVTLVSSQEPIGVLLKETLKQLFEGRRAVSQGMKNRGCDSWEAFRSPDPGNLEKLLRNGLDEFEFLLSALHRHLEEFPSSTNGLSRTETLILRLIRGRGRNPVEVWADGFLAPQEEPEDPTMVQFGDGVFVSYLERLSTCRFPLLAFEDGKPVEKKLLQIDRRAFWKTRLVLTAAGEDVFSGRKDHVNLGNLDRWLGGVQLRSGFPLWRWDSAAGCLKKDDD